MTIRPSAAGSLFSSILVLLLVPVHVDAAIAASGDISKPSQNTVHLVAAPIAENVGHDDAAGPWLKDLVNNTGGHASGQNVALLEDLTNTGLSAWTGWTERVVTRSTINQPNDAPGFLFRDNTISLQADYGSGFVNLVQGTDYTIAGVPFFMGGNGGHYEEFTITLSPAAQIAVGDTLRISKDIFEIFGDANIWQANEIAQIAEFPLVQVPEPAGLALIPLLVAAGLSSRRRASTCSTGAIDATG